MRLCRFWHGLGRGGQERMKFDLTDAVSCSRHCTSDCAMAPVENLEHTSLLGTRRRLPESECRHDMPVLCMRLPLRVSFCRRRSFLAFPNFYRGSWFVVPLQFVYFTVF